MKLQFHAAITDPTDQPCLQLYVPLRTRPSRSLSSLSLHSSAVDYSKWRRSHRLKGIPLNFGSSEFRVAADNTKLIDILNGTLDTRLILAMTSEAAQGYHIAVIPRH